MGIGDILVTAKKVRYQPPQRSLRKGGERPPLDPEARTFLEFAAALGRPPSYSLPYDEARQAVHDAGPKLSLPGPEMASVADLAVPGGAGAIRARLYTPPELKGQAPLLIFFHGGGFVYCDLDTHDGLCRSLAMNGRCRVASVDYRLAPEAIFPAACDDALAATRWLVGQAERMDVDPRRIAIGGDSAGGNLAAGVAQMVPSLAGQLLIYPWLDMRMRHRSHYVNANGYMLTRASLLWFRSHYLADLNQRDDPRASPILTPSLVGLPPAFMLTAGYDPLRDEAIDYARRLNEAGVPVRHSEHRGQIHGFAMMNRVMSAADVAVQEIGDWLVDLWEQPISDPS